MTHEIVNGRDRIVQDRSSASGTAVVKGTDIPVELVLATLASSLDVDVLFREYPAPTRDDVRAALSFARDRVRGADEPAPSADAISPQDFYAEMTQRPDVSELMRRLAR